MGGGGGGRVMIKMGRCTFVQLKQRNTRTQKKQRQQNNRVWLFLVAFSILIKARGKGGLKELGLWVGASRRKCKKTVSEPTARALLFVRKSPEMTARAINITSRTTAVTKDVANHLTLHYPYSSNPLQGEYQHKPTPLPLLYC